MKQFKYIGNIAVEELNTISVHACINEDGFRCILIKNAQKKTILTKYDTDNMEIKLNSVLQFMNEDYYFHIITSKNNDKESNEQFRIVYEYIFQKIQEPVTDDALAKLVLSLEEYFRITPEKDNRKLQIGVFGELLCIDYLHKNGCDNILQKYHNNFFLKHDVEISEKLRIEIKTSINEKRIHHFRHDQLCREDVFVIVASVLLEESREGTSLWNMFERVIALLNDPDDIFAIRKVVRMCDVSEDKQGLCFSEGKAWQDIRFFDAKSLPQVLGVIPPGVTKVEYDVDCALGNNIVVSDVIKKISE